MDGAVACLQFKRSKDFAIGEGDLGLSEYFVVAVPGEGEGWWSGGGVWWGR